MLRIGQLILSFRPWQTQSGNVSQSLTIHSKYRVAGLFTNAVSVRFRVDRTIRSCDSHCDYSIAFPIEDRHPTCLFQSAREMSRVAESGLEYFATIEGFAQDISHYLHFEMQELL